MADHRKGTDSPAHPLRRAEKQLASLMTQESNLIQSIASTQEQLADLRTRLLPEAKADLERERRKVDVSVFNEQAAQFRAEWFALATDLDSHGESPQRLARWLWLCGALRSAGLLTASHWRCRLTLDQLRGLDKKNAPLPLSLRSWSAIAKAWVKAPAQQEQAA
jgi:hypothetical protein